MPLIMTTPFKTFITNNYWYATLGETNTESGYGFAKDSLGNLYITGTTYSQGISGDICIAKYSSSGVLQWQRIIGSVPTDVSTGVTVDTSNNVYVVFQSYTYALGNYDVGVFKYDSSGTLLWSVGIGDIQNDTVQNTGLSVTTDNSNNVYVVGSSLTYDGNNAFAFIVKLNSSGALQWQKTLSSPGSCRFYSCCVDNSGNILAAGFASNIPGGAGNDAVLIKYDSSGNIIWQRYLSASSNDFLYGVIADASDNIYVCGYTDSQGAGSQDTLIAKYNSSGTLQWQRLLGGAGIEQATYLALDSSNNVYVCGQTSSQGAGGVDALVAKYNSSGTIQWQRAFGGTGTDVFGSGVAITDTDMYLSGHTQSVGQGSSDFLLVKLPTDGTLTGTYSGLTYQVTTLTEQVATLTDSSMSLTTGTGTFQISSLPVNTGNNVGWKTSLPSSHTSGSTLIGTDGSGNVYYTGYVVAGAADMFICKLNSSGVVQWQKSYGGVDSEYTYCIAVSSTGDVVIAGRGRSQTAGIDDGHIVKFDTSGNFQWARRLGGTGTEQFLGTHIDSSGNVYVCGQTNTSGQTAGSYDILTAKYDSAGNLSWQRRLGGAGLDIGYSIYTDSSSNVYVCGYTNSQGAGGTDGVIAQYNSSGTLQWQKLLGGAGTEGFYGIVVDSSNSIYVCGQTTSQGAGGSDVLVVKYNSSGTVQWQRTIGSTANEQAVFITKDASDNVYVCANGTSSYMNVIAKYNSSGTLQWKKVFSLEPNIVGIAAYGSYIYFLGSSGGVYQMTTNGDYMRDSPYTGNSVGLTANNGTLTAANTTLTNATLSLTVNTTALTPTTVNVPEGFVEQASTLISTKVLIP